MLSFAIVVPLLGALALWAARGLGERQIRILAIIITAIPLVVMVVSWARFDTGAGDAFQLVQAVSWIPSLGVGWRVGVDGIALAMATLSAVLFCAAAAYPVDTLGRPRQYYGWLLFLETVSLGLFLTLDLLVFYVFFDLSLVGMYFLIGRWGHGDHRQAALKFFLYTLAGSLVMLLGILGLALANDPITFDMAELIRNQPLAGAGVRGGLVLVALLVGLGVKTPLVPVHTWLPPAHVDAPGPASTILAGVLLKMGTFGMIRIPFAMMRQTFADGALVLGVVAVVSIVYGSLVALGQSNLKARIAYTSINHMGYVVLGIAVAGALLGGEEQGRQLALTGAVVQMVAHGLTTGVLFLLAGSFWQRTQDYDLGAYGGLAGLAPRLTAITTLAAFSSLGLPGLAQFVGEVQVFAGTFTVYPVLAAVALLGLLVTAALFLQMLQKLFFGARGERHPTFPDLSASEGAVLVVLGSLIVVLGIYPRWLIDVVASTSAALVGGG